MNCCWFKKLYKVGIEGRSKNKKIVDKKRDGFFGKGCVYGGFCFLYSANNNPNTPPNKIPNKLINAFRLPLSLISGTLHSLDLTA